MLLSTRTGDVINLNWCCCHATPMLSSTHTGTVVTPNWCRRHPATVLLSPHIGAFITRPTQGGTGPTAPRTNRNKGLRRYGGKGTRTMRILCIDRDEHKEAVQYKTLKKRQNIFDSHFYSSIIPRLARTWLTLWSMTAWSAGWGLGEAGQVGTERVEPWRQARW